MKGNALKKIKTGNGKRTVMWLLLAVYFVFMMYILLLQRAGSPSELSYSEYYKTATNFVPFKTLRSYYGVLAGKYGSGVGIMGVAFRNLVGNVVLFMPIGIFLPAMWKKQRNFLIFIVTAVLAIALVEAAQFATKLGACDVDDLILNVTGAVMGYLIWLIPPVKKIFSIKK